MSGREGLNGWKLRDALKDLPITERVVPIAYRDPRVLSPGVRRLGNTHHRLLELIAGFEDRSGRHYYYSVPQLGAMLHKTENWTRCCLRDLEHAGLLDTCIGGGRLPGGRGGRANEYRVQVFGNPIREPHPGTPSGRKPNPLRPEGVQSRSYPIRPEGATRTLSPDVRRASARETKTECGSRRLRAPLVTIF